MNSQKDLESKVAILVGEQNLTLIGDVLDAIITVCKLDKEHNFLPFFKYESHKIIPTDEFYKMSHAGELKKEKKKLLQTLKRNLIKTGRGV